MCRWGRTLRPAPSGCREEGNMLGQLKRAKRWLIVVLLLTAGVGSLAPFFSHWASVNASDEKTIIRGGGKTIIHGRTGPVRGFIPVLTTIAFHAENARGRVTGSIELLALATEKGTGTPCAHLTVYDMYFRGMI